MNVLDQSAIAVQEYSRLWPRSRRGSVCGHTRDVIPTYGVEIQLGAHPLNPAQRWQSYLRESIKSLARL